MVASQAKRRVRGPLFDKRSAAPRPGSAIRATYDALLDVPGRWVENPSTKSKGILPQLRDFYGLEIESRLIGVVGLRGSRSMLRLRAYVDRHGERVEVPPVGPDPGRKKRRPRRTRDEISADLAAWLRLGDRRGKRRTMTPGSSG